MSEAEIKKYDPDDVELQALMGDKFQVGKFQRMEQYTESNPNYVGKFSKPRASHVTDDYPASGEDISEAENTAEGASYKPMTAKPSFFDKLTECAKTSVAFGGLNLLLFYWMNTGLMAESIAVPSMCVCATLFGLGIGKVVGKR